MKTYMVLAAGVAGIFLLGLLNLAGGNELGFFVFYFVPVAFVAWHRGPVMGYAVSALSACVWFLADYCSGHSYSSDFYAWWNTGIRFVSFLIVAVSFSTIHKLLSEARVELNTLRGFLRVCAWCRKVARPDGEWVPMEAFFDDRTNVRLTHGMCPQCSEKLTREAIGGGIETPLVQPREAHVRKSP